MMITAMMAIPLVQHFNNEHVSSPVETYYSENARFVYQIDQVPLAQPLQNEYTTVPVESQYIKNTTFAYKNGPISNLSMHNENVMNGRDSSKTQAITCSNANFLFGKFSYKIKTGSIKQAINVAVYNYNSTSFFIIEYFDGHLQSRKIVSIDDTLFSTRNQGTDSIRLPNNSALKVIRHVTERNGMINHIFMRIPRENYSLKIILLHSHIISGKSPNQLLSVKERKYYFFLPEYYPPNHLGSNTSNITKSTIIGPPGSGGFGSYVVSGSLSLQEKDNSATKYNVWHIGLGITQYICGNSKFDGSISLSPSFGADSRFNNWWLKSSTSGISAQSSTERTVYAKAFFYGVFPLGYDDNWFAYPQVSITVSNSGALTGCITIPIFASGPSNPLTLWSDITPTNGSFSGQESFTECIVS